MVDWHGWQKDGLYHFTLNKLDNDPAWNIKWLVPDLYGRWQKMDAVLVFFYSDTNEVISRRMMNYASMKTCELIAIFNMLLKSENRRLLYWLLCEQCNVLEDIEHILSKGSKCNMRED